MDAKILSETYVDKVAKNYDTERVGQGKWVQEQKAMDKLIAHIPEGSSLIDIPVGTGRFFPFYKERNLNVTGLDISKDMLSEAQQKAKKEKLENVDFKVENILDISLKDGAVTTCLCVRFLNWLKWPLVEQAFSEIHRVSSQYMIVGMRHNVPWCNLLLPMPDVKRIYGRIIRYAKNIFRSEGLVYHKKRDIKTLFETNNVKVLEVICIHERNDGTDYYFYLLEK